MAQNEKKTSEAVFEVWIAGFDKMEYYIAYCSEREAIACANTLKKYNTGSVFVYRVERIYSI